MNLSKETLRIEAIRHRERIDAGEESENPELARDLFFECLEPRAGQVVGIYWPKAREFDIGAIIERLLKENITCAIPVIENRAERVMKFARWRDGDPLERGPFKVMQPLVTDKTEWLDPDIVIVPLLAFDRKGIRLGYGGGHYDATLADLRSRKKITAVGVAYAQQAVLFNLPAEPHDQPLDWVITPQNAHCYKS